MKKILLGICFLICALPVSAMHLSSDYKAEAPVNPFWFNPYMGVSAGYGEMDNMLNDDGQTAIERIAIGVEAFSWWRASFGFELGVQTGNTTRHASNILLGNTPIPLTVKPMVDMLVTARVKVIPGSNVYLLAKGGAAYRRMQVNDRTSIPSLHEWSGELQAGVGYEFTPHARVSVYYQGIFSDDCACLTTDPVTLRGKFKHIPPQEAGFIGFEYSAL